MEVKGQGVSESPCAAGSGFQALNWNLMLPSYICKRKKRKISVLLKGRCGDIHQCSRLAQVDISCFLFLLFNLQNFVMLIRVCIFFFFKCWRLTKHAQSLRRVVGILSTGRYVSVGGVGMFGWSFWTGQNLFYEGNWCFAAREEGKAGMKLCRGSDPYRSIWESWGRTTGVWQHGVAGLGWRSELRYS